MLRNDSGEFYKHSSKSEKIMFSLLQIVTCFTNSVLLQIFPKTTLYKSAGL